MQDENNKLKQEFQQESQNNNRSTTILNSTSDATTYASQGSPHEPAEQTRQRLQQTPTSVD